ncbi:MAG: hypothetical protein IKR94_06240 [Bacteroidales bacterium]|nr:hypothetical protein [Bacteroidales bacterium]
MRQLQMAMRIHQPRHNNAIIKSGIGSLGIKCTHTQHLAISIINRHRTILYRCAGICKHVVGR